MESGCVEKAQTQGVAQGSIAGPLLWNVLFDEVLNMNFGPEVRLQSYADDLLVEISMRLSQRTKGAFTLVKDQLEALSKKGGTKS